MVFVVKFEHILDFVLMILLTLTHISHLVLVFLLWTLNKCVCAKQGKILLGKIYSSDQTPTDGTRHKKNKIKAQEEQEKRTNSSIALMLVS